MLKMSGSLINRPIMSIRTGTPIGRATEPIISPHNLKIVGWWCESPDIKGHSILLAEDVREVMTNGFAVNDESVLSSPNELVRHREILDINFQLIGKPVKTKRHKLGKVSDYNYDEASMMVQKFYVSRPMFKVFTNDDTLIIDRRQIVEVTDSYILVDDAEVKESEEAVAPEAAPAA